MNIFVVDSDPKAAAQSLCNRHVVKMVLETAQILCTVTGYEVYKPTHAKHPCTLWAARSYGNLQWLYLHGVALSEEYTRRYGKIHKSEDVIHGALKYYESACSNRPTEYEQTPFVVAMPEECKTSSVVESYRSYYRLKDSEWASKGRPMKFTNSQRPDWLSVVGVA